MLGRYALSRLDRLDLDEGKTDPRTVLLGAAASGLSQIWPHLYAVVGLDDDVVCVIPATPILPMP